MTKTVEITREIAAFRKVIACAWDEVAALAPKDPFDSFIDDWLQSAWERLVEAAISPSGEIALEPYGDGADCNGGSSRILMPERLPTHRVAVVAPDGGELYDLVNGKPLAGSAPLYRFCTMVDGWPTVAAPFDAVALDVPEQGAVSASGVRFLAEPLGSAR